MTALLEARRVTKVFGGGMFKSMYTTALQDFSLTVDDAAPSITCIVGESGSGKSTMARLLLGLETPTSGSVLYRGTALADLSRPQKQQFRREVQAVFQDPFAAYNPVYRIDHVLEVPIDKFGLAHSNADSRALIEEVLQTVGLRPQDTLGRFPHQLSGGQRQRVMVARALLLRPKLIIADEPVSMIDASLRASVLDSLRQLNREFGISLIYITHDLTTAYQVGQNIVVLYSGSVAEAGSVEAVVKQPKHPYTQLLIESIPLPNLEHKWQDEAPPSDMGRKASGVGCKFAPRCPHAFEPCLKAAPPLYEIQERQAAACYLYMEHAVIQSEDMDRLFGGSPSDSSERAPERSVAK